MKDFTDYFVFTGLKIILIVALLYYMGINLLSSFLLLITLIIFPFFSYIRYIGLEPSKSNFEDSELSNYSRVIRKKYKSTLIDKVCFMTYLIFILFATILMLYFYYEEV